MKKKNIFATLLGVALLATVVWAFTPTSLSASGGVGTLHGTIQNIEDQDNWTDTGVSQDYVFVINDGTTIAMDGHVLHLIEVKTPCPEHSNPPTSTRSIYKSQAVAHSMDEMVPGGVYYEEFFLIIHECFDGYIEWTYTTYVTYNQAAQDAGYSAWFAAATSGPRAGFTQ